MNIEDLRTFCLSLPHVTEDFPFAKMPGGDSVLVFRIANKIFCVLDLDNTERFTLKITAERSEELRSLYSDIIPAPHWGKKNWVSVPIGLLLSDAEYHQLITEGYRTTIATLPKKVQLSIAEICRH